MVLENLKNLGGRTSATGKAPVKSGLKNLSALAGETSVETIEQPAQPKQPEFKISAPGPTVLEDKRQELLLEERKKTEPWYKKAARAILPKAAEKALGFDKEPSTADEVIKTYEEAYAKSDLTRLQKQLYEGKGKLPKQTTEDVIKETSPGKYLPFVSGAESIKDAVQLYGSAKRMENGTATFVDEYRISKYAADQTRDKTFGAQVASVLMQLPAFAGELLLTGGIYSAGKKATEKAIQKTLEKAVGKTAGRITTKIAGNIIGGTLQTIPARGLEITAGAIQNMMPDTQFTQSELGKIKMELSGEGDDLVKAILKSGADQWVEVVTEHSGGLLTEAITPIKNQFLKIGLLKAFLKANPSKSVSAFMDLVKRAGWNGVLGEMFEERAGEVARGVLTQIGLSEEGWKFPTPEQLAVELVSFSIPGVMISTINKGIVSQQKLSLENLKNLTIEQIIEQQGGWKEGMRQKFDKALDDKNAKTVKELLPEVPEKYKQRFAAEIEALIGEAPETITQLQPGPLYNLKKLSGEVPTAEETTKTPTALELQKQIEVRLEKQRTEAEQTGKVVVQEIIKIDDTSEFQSNTLTELELAKAGTRHFIGDEYTGHKYDEVITEPSTFPDWIPDPFRTSGIVNTFLDNIEKNTLPINQLDIEFYNFMSEYLKKNNKNIAEEELKDELEIANLEATLNEDIINQKIYDTEQQIKEISGAYAQEAPIKRDVEEGAEKRIGENVVFNFENLRGEKEVVKGKIEKFSPDFDFFTTIDEKGVRYMAKKTDILLETKKKEEPNGIEKAIEKARKEGRFVKTPEGEVPLIGEVDSKTGKITLFMEKPTGDDVARLGKLMKKENVIKELRKWLPEKDIKILTQKDMIIMDDGRLAYGSSVQGLIKLVEEDGKVYDKAAYHEAFHQYEQSFLTEDQIAETNQLVQEYASKQGIFIKVKDILEIKADWFADFVAERKTFTGRLLQIFKKMLLHIRKWIDAKNRLTEVFYDILRGRRPEIAVEKLVRETYGELYMAREPGPDEIGIWKDGTPYNAAHLDKIKPIEFPEIVSIARELLQGGVPQITTRLRSKMGVFHPEGKGKIRLRADIFSKEFISKGYSTPSKVLAHEIGHLVDWLPDNIMKRGNLLGRLFTLAGFLKGTYGFPAVNNARVREELKALTRYWHPFDDTKVSKSYKNYRDSAKELYAEAISVLFVDPATLEKMAPNFYNTFFTELDNKPSAKQAYFETQAILTQDRDTLIRYRRAGVKGMFDDADIRAKDLQKLAEEKKKWSLKDFWIRLNNDYATINYYFEKKIKDLRKKGVEIRTDENPFDNISRRNRVASEIQQVIQFEFKPISEKLIKEGIDWNTLGEFMFYERIVAGDRSDLANPRGITTEAAQELIESVRLEYGEDKFKILEEQADKYRSVLKNWSKVAVDQEGMYRDELADMINKNDKYAPFRVIEHIDEQVSAKVHKQVGTLKDVENPADTIMLKTLAVVKAIEFNKAKRTAVEFIEKHAPEDVRPADTISTPKGKIPKPSKVAGEGLVMYHSGGKLQGVYVDEYISNSLNNNTMQVNMAILNGMNSLNRSVVKPLFVQYNPGWLLFNIIRDFDRTWSAMPAKTFIGTISNFVRLSWLYKKSLRPAFQYTFGIKNFEELTGKKRESAELVKKLLSERILSVTYNELKEGQDPTDIEFERILQKVNIGKYKKKSTHPFLVPLVRLLDFISDLGSLVETLPKISGYYYYTAHGSPEYMYSDITTKWGSPNFFEKGRATPALNSIFLFANPIIQSIRADIDTSVNPRTRSGFWWSQSLKVAVPSLLMLAAALGYFGKDTKRKMDSATEYDKTNYIIIPICFDDSGKSTYIRVPLDEGSRLLKGMFWKTINTPQNQKSFAKDAMDVASILGGQLPSFSPVVETVMTTAQMLAGGNPYDFYRNRPILTDQQLQAGGKYKWKPYMYWVFQNFGGNVFMKMYNYGYVPTEKSAGQKIFEAPIIGNILGRFVKFSDYGLQEDLKDVRQTIEQKKARENIEASETLNQYLKQYMKEGGNLEKYANDFAITVVPKITSSEDLEKRNNYRKKFRISALKGKDDPYVSAFLSANTNEEKIVILQNIKDTTGTAEYNELKQLLLREGVLTTGVLMKIK